MPNQYYTVHEGIRGTGKPLVAKASEAVEEGSEKRTSETGGTYSGLLLSESAMQSMKEAAGDFYIFNPDQNRDKDGQLQYTVQATLPTKVGTFTNPMKTFNLLEQNNRLVKGMASMFYNAEGKLDTNKADKFMAELSIRTDIDLYGVLNPDDVTMGNLAAKEANKTWICEQFHIPAEERPEFKTFLDTAFFETQEHRIYKNSNFHQLWRSFSNKLSGVDELLQSDALTPDMKVKVEAGKVNAVKELEEMAGMDPKTSQKAYVPTECNGSSNSMMILTQMNHLGKGLPPSGSKFHVDMNNEESKKIQVMKAAETEANREFLQKRKEYEELIATPPQEEAEIAEYNRKLAAGAEGLVRLDEVKKQSKALAEEAEYKRRNLLKWDFHEAPVVGQMNGPDGKPVMLTLEAFAPEAGTYFEHPGMTAGVSFGAYRSEEDFKAYYLKDDAYAKSVEEVQAIAQFKSSQVDVYEKKSGELYERFAFKRFCSNYEKEINDETRQMLGEHYEEEARTERESHLKNPGEKYTPKAGIDGTNLTTDYEMAAREYIRTSAVSSAFIAPAKQQEYQAMLQAFSHAVDAANRLNVSYLNYSTLDAKHGDEVIEYSSEVPPYDRKSITCSDLAVKMHDALDAETIPHLMARDGLIKLLNHAQGKFDKTLVTAAEYEAMDAVEREKHLHMNIDEEQAVSDYIRGSGFTVGDLIRVGREPLVIPTSINMDIQAFTPTYAEGFGAEVLKGHVAMDPGKREFGAHNYDATFQLLYPQKTQLELARAGKDQFDCVFVNGVSINELYKAKYKELQPFEREKMLKCEVCAAVFSGQKLDCVSAHADETGKLIYSAPISVTAESKLPSLEEPLAVFHTKEQQERATYTERIVQKLAAPAIIQEHDTVMPGVKGVGKAVVGLAGAEVERTSGGTFQEMTVSREIKEQLEKSSSLYAFTEVHKQGQESVYKMDIQMPEEVSNLTGDKTVKFRENYNLLVKGMAGKFFGANGQLDLSKQNMERFKAFTSNMRMMFDEYNPIDMKNPAATPEQVRTYRNEWLCTELGIPEDKRAGFTDFFDTAYGPNTEEKALTNSNFNTLWLNFAGKAEIASEVRGQLSGPGKMQLRLQVENTEKALREMSQLDPETSTKAYIPTECSGSSRMLSGVQRLIDITKGKHSPMQQGETLNAYKMREKIGEDGTPEHVSISITMKESAKLKQGEKLSDKGELKWDYHEAKVLSSIPGTGETPVIITAEAFAAESNVLFDEPAMTSHVYFGIHNGLKGFEHYYEQDNPFIRADAHDDLVISDMKNKAYGASYYVDALDAAEVSRDKELETVNQTQAKVLSDADVKTIEGFGKVIDEEQKFKESEKILKSLTGIAVGDGGASDVMRNKQALDKICINGIPFSAAYEEEITPDNYKKAVIALAERVSHSMDVDAPQSESIAVKSNGTLHPVLYVPKEPKEPEAVSTKVHFYSSKEVRDAHAVEQERFERESVAYDKKQEVCERWSKRNAFSIEAVEAHNEVIADTDKIANAAKISETASPREKMSFNDLVSEVSVASKRPKAMEVEVPQKQGVEASEKQGAVKEH